jgi:Uma2 family endonuclease
MSSLPPTALPPAPDPPPDYSPRLFTVADLAVLPSDLPSGPVLYELHHGRLLTMPPPGDVHGAIEANLAAALKYQGEYRGLGKARSGEVTIVLGRNPDHVFGADAGFIAKSSLPIRRSSEGYLETIPDLVVEVRSKNDTMAALERKAADYLAAGVRVVWVVDPGARAVTEYRRDTVARVFAENETLTVEDVIPGFQLPVRDALQE